MCMSICGLRDKWDKMYLKKNLYLYLDVSIVNNSYNVIDEGETGWSRPSKIKDL